MTGGNRTHDQRGGMLSLVLTLLAIGALAYFALRSSGGGSATAVGSGEASISCEQQIAKLIGKTGGQGPDYKRGYDVLPPPCRKLVPAPDALAAPAMPDT